MMERRTFLRGLIASVGAGTALVRLANAEETACLAMNAPVGLYRIQPQYCFPVLDSCGAELYMRRDGEFVPIGYVTEVHVTDPVGEEASWDGRAILVPVLQRAELKFHGKRAGA